MKPNSNKHHTRRSLIPGKFLIVMTNVTNVVIPTTWSDSSVLLTNTCAEIARFGYFRSLCYKKQESFKNTSSRSPNAHQLMIGIAYMKDSLCSQSEDSSSNNSFCLQMQVKSAQAEAKLPAPQHLATNLAYKLKLHQK